MSRILNRQRQLAEQGRIRLGFTLVSAKTGKAYPKASDTFVLTSHSREHIAKAADVWGGDVEEWQPLGNGAQQWRCITKSSEIDAILPPGDPLSQAYEMWSKGGCVRRCDGLTEQLSGSPCPCFAQFGDDWYEQPQGKVCDSKSRLKVLLPDMPGLGSWRLETGSFYATDEIAGMVDFIRGSVGDQTMVPVRLRIEPRTRVAGGQTKQFVVPVLDLRGVTAGALVSGAYTDIRQVEGGRAASAPALEAGPAVADADEVAVDWRKLADDCDSLDAVRALWTRAGQAGALDDDLQQYLFQRGQTFNPKAAPESSTPEPDADTVWQEILKVAGREGMTLDQVEADFVTWAQGVEAAEADGRTLAAYLADLEGR